MYALVLKILFKLEKLALDFQEKLRALQKKQIEKLIEENKSEIDELTQQNIYLKGLLKKY